MPLVAEDRLYHHKLVAVLSYVRANRLNQVTFDRPDARIGIISAGKAWQDVVQALEQLGASNGELAGIGVKLLKIGMVWPLDAECVRSFSAGLEVVVVVEEKRPLLEDQVRSALYGLPSTPRIVGKHFDATVFGPERKEQAFPNAGEITPSLVAQVLARVMLSVSPHCGLATPSASAPAKQGAISNRMPGFCSGCPHNRSTKVVGGSRALAGIGCHTMAMLVNPKTTTTVSHMGAEGVMWLGQQPFTSEEHVFANMGDGTFAHSGLLAIRQAIAAGVPITYKLLYNGFVSMTGGQPIEGALTPAQITAALSAEGVRKMAVVTDDPGRYDDVVLPPGVAVHSRSRLEAVELEFREYGGVSVIVFDQVCATERRRLRKRGKLPDPSVRTFINAAVCEGCGDCGVASNCMSIEPLETDLGRKRKINQSSCNKDYSCVEGFCPSFVTVHGGQPRSGGTEAKVARAPHELSLEVPEPDIRPLGRAFRVLLVGIGGTGVVTVGQMLAVAAHVDGYFSSNLDITGLSQKYGAVTSHVQFAPSPEKLHASRIDSASADTLLAFDLLVGAGDECVSKIAPKVTRGAVSTDTVPTSEFARNPNWSMDVDALSGRLKDVLHGSSLFFDVQHLARAILGDAIVANMVLLGAAWQLGQVPLSLGAIERAIELNGAGSELNKKAFRLGRQYAHSPSEVLQAARATHSTNANVIRFVPRRSQSLDALIAHRAEHLLAHTGERLKARYLAFVAKVVDAERRSGLGDALSRAVAHSYHRLLAVKDEWEVARLFSTPEFRASLEAEFQGEYSLRFHLGAWPFARVDSATGKIQKRQVGPWLLPAMRLMAIAKGLRGTLFDPFRNGLERKLDSQLLAEYEGDLAFLLAHLSAQNHEVAVAIASLPDSIRGYGHVKAAAAEQARTKRSELMKQLNQRAGEPKLSA
jgi:indolepyruvate ferredoxin oxidoreductase